MDDIDAAHELTQELADATAYAELLFVQLDELRKGRP